MSRNQRLAYAAIAVLIAVIAVIVLATGGDDAEDLDTPIAGATPTATASSGRQEEEASPGPEATADPTPEPTPEPPMRIRVRNGEVVGGEAEIEVDSGDRVRFVVTSDVTDHVHVHGYDVLRDVAPGQPARFSFPADITGVFEVELEESGLPVARLRVNQ